MRYYKEAAGSIIEELDIESLKIDGFTTIEIFGEGAHGAVLKAFSHELQNNIAIKIFPPENDRAFQREREIFFKLLVLKRMKMLSSYWALSIKPIAMPLLLKLVLEHFIIIVALGKKKVQP